MVDGLVGAGKFFGRVVDLAAEDLADKHDLLAAWAQSAGSESLAGPGAFKAPLLTQVAAVAVAAGVDGAVSAGATGRYRRGGPGRLVAAPVAVLPARW